MQVLGELSQGITKLATKTRRQNDPIPFQPPATPPTTSIRDGTC